MDDAAGQVIHSCLTALHNLLEALLKGHVLLGHLQTCLKYKNQFKAVFQQCKCPKCQQNPFRITSFICPGVKKCCISSTDKKNTKLETVPVEADVVLAQREADLNHFILRKKQIDTLIKMIGKVMESITGGLRVSAVT